MITNARAVILESLRFWNHRLIAVRRALLKDSLVTRFHMLLAEFRISRNRAPHVRWRRLETNDLPDHRQNKGSLRLYPVKFLQEVIEKGNTAGQQGLSVIDHAVFRCLVNTLGVAFHI